jgi:hypothetical protein
MTTWTTDELDRVGRAAELHVTRLPQGRIRAGGLECDVAFAPAGTTATAASLRLLPR